MHRTWITRLRLDDTLAHRALEEMLTHLDGRDRQLDGLDRELEQIAPGERWASPVEVQARLKGVLTRTALGPIAEIGDFHRFSHPRELCAWLGIAASEQQRHRAPITQDRQPSLGRRDRRSRARCGCLAATATDQPSITEQPAVLKAAAA